MERCGYVELGRGVRYLCDLPSSSDGCVSPVSSGEQEGRQSTGLRGRLGRMQPFFSSLLHVSLDATEQSLPPVSARVVHSANGQITEQTEPTRRLFSFLLVSPPFSSISFSVFPLVTSLLPRCDTFQYPRIAFYPKDPRTCLLQPSQKNLIDSFARSQFHRFGYRFKTILSRGTLNRAIVSIDGLIVIRWYRNLAVALS